MDNGFIKSFRSLLGWRWFKYPATAHLWETIRLLASWQENEKANVILQPGQLITTYPELCEVSGLSYSEVRISIGRLKQTGEIAVKTTNKYSLITVANWEDYQILGGKKKRKAAAKNADKRQSNDSQNADNGVDTLLNKEGEEVKEGKNGASRFIPPSIDEVRNYCKKRNNKVNPQSFHDFYSANGWVQGRGKPIKDWQAAVRTWERGEMGKAQSRKNFYELGLEMEDDK